MIAVALTLLWSSPNSALRFPILLQDSRTPDFSLDILPVLTKLGCNTGACHGAAKGQNGFKLSLLGYDPAADYEALATELLSRRVNRARPEESLMILKPTERLEHGGRRRLKEGSAHHRLLLDWIRAGAPAKTRGEKLLTVRVIPDAKLVALNSAVQLRVEASYTGGVSRDVTALALYSTNDDAVATVTPEGLVHVRGRGETAIVASFGGHVLSTLIGSPLGETSATFQAANFIDEILSRKWRALGIQPGKSSSDAVFLRRAYLDVIGTLPTPAEAKAFLAEPDRGKLIDKLLTRPEFDALWTLKFSEWLMVGAQKFPERYPAWIRGQIARDAPLNETAAALLTATGDAPPGGFFLSSRDPRQLMELTIQVFHGFRMQCANCHNHPLERFSQDQYHSLSAFFARVRIEGEGVVIEPRGELTHPRTGKPVTAALADGRAWTEDRREALSEWLTSDRRFARAIANRLWGDIFGRGIVHPVDDMRASNPPLIPELLEALSDEFTRTPRLRPFLRMLLTSNAYGLESGADDRYFARAVIKPLGAEVLQDAIGAAAGKPGPRAIDRVQPSHDYTLEAFGRCRRDTLCTLKADFQGSLKQALHLISDDVISVANIDVSKNNRELVDDLYLRALSRPASPAELARWAPALEKDRRAVAEDLFWALVVSNEFQFRH